MGFHYKNILIAIDDSDLSTKAFNRAVYIAKRDEAILTIAHVINTKNTAMLQSYLGDIDEWYKQSESDIKKKLNNYEQIAKDAGVLNTKKVIKFGTPKNVLVEEIIPEEKIDLAIFGATGVNVVEYVFLGSMPDYAMRHSNSDVLVIR